MRRALLITLVLGATTGAFRPLPAPAVSNTHLSALIQRALGESDPTVVIVLNQRVEAGAKVPYADLKRAAASRGWRVYGDAMAIPVGRLEYVSNSAVIDRRPDPLFRATTDAYDLTFGYRFVGNRNADYLLRFAPSSHWMMRLSNLPSVQMKNGRMKVLLYRWHGVWSLGKIPYYQTPSRGTP